MVILYADMIDDKQDLVRFDSLVYAYQHQMLLVAREVLGDMHLAEDAVQVALLRIAQYIRSVPRDSKEAQRAYVLAAARRAALDLLERQKHWNKMLDISDLSLAAPDDLFEQVAASQDYDLLQRAMRQLPPYYRDVLVLKYIHGYSVREIANIVGRKHATVVQQLTRGKKALIALCGKEGMDLGF